MVADYLYWCHTNWTPFQDRQYEIVDPETAQKYYDEIESGKRDGFITSSFEEAMLFYND